MKQQTILYPFAINGDNIDSFSNTLELAKAKKAKVLCFSCVGIGKIDDAYLHLLQLNGHYQSNFTDWRQTTMPPIEKNIVIGPFNKQLRQLLETSTIDIVIQQNYLEAVDWNQIAPLAELVCFEEDF